MSQSNYTTEEKAAIQVALSIMEKHCVYGEPLSSPSQVRDYLRLRFGSEEREVFAVVHLNAQHSVTQVEELFHGTLSQTSVHPREVVRSTLMKNTAAVILCHNHPSGSVKPSRADEHLTTVLKSALALVDVRVLDHIIVSGQGTMSFAEVGLL